MNVTSTLDNVTAYREGAVCTRKAMVEPIATGVPAELRLVGLPLSLSPGSLRARVVKGPADLRVLDVRPAFDVQLAAEVDAPAEKKALDAAIEAESLLNLKLARLEIEISELEQLRPTFLEHKVGTPPREAPVAAMIALADFTDGRLAQRLDKRRAMWREMEDAHAETELRRRRLAEASAAIRTERARVSRCAIVSLSAPTSNPIELSLEYQVPGVRWVPNYQLKLDQGVTGGSLLMRASVAQSTGEDWTGVSLALSTASLNRRTDLPELKALKIGRSQPEPARPGWREPPPGLDALFEGYDEAMRGMPMVSPPGQAAPRGGAATSGYGAVAHGKDVDEGRRAEPREKKKSAPPRGAPMPAAPPPPPPVMAPAMSRSSVVGALGGAVAKAFAAPMKPMARPVAPGSPPADRLQRARHDYDDEPTASSDMSLDLDELEEGRAPTGEFAMQAEESEAQEMGIDASFLDYSRLVMTGLTDGGARGRLRTAGQWELQFAASVQIDVVMRLVSQAENRAASVYGLPLPSSCSPVRSLDSFDYRYDCAGRVDVGSTGSWLTVPVMDCKVGLTFELVCVPSVEAKVYRTLLIKNATPHALLAGPVDVSAGDEFLITTTLPAIPPGADTLRLGLGVEEAVKVARKTQFKETSGGFLGGSTVLPHEISIEVNNRLSTPARLEVRERVPFPDPSEKDVKIEETQVTPPWEKVETPIDGEIVNGMRRWRVSVPAGQKMTLLAQFNVRIPAGKMLVGGNRRV